MRGRVVITFYVHRNGALTDVTVVRPSEIESFNTAAVNALLASNPTTPLPPEYPDDKAFFTVTFYYNESPPGSDQVPAGALRATVPRAREPLIAILGPTATGKSALGIALAERFNGEIINCDSTAVYRGFDIGTDKVPLDQRRGIAHHLIDIADPTDEYTAAQFARDAAAAVDDIHARGKLPILVGGTGFYYRALTRGLFPGPGKDAELRARLEAIAAQKGVETLHRMVARVDPESGARIQPRDLKRLVRALEVYFQTGKPLTAHFEDTVSPLAPDVQVGAIALAHACTVAGRAARQARRRAVRRRAARRNPRACSPPACLPTRARSADWSTARRWITSTASEIGSRNARTYCAGEPEIRATAVDLVPKRA